MAPIPTTSSRIPKVSVVMAMYNRAEEIEAAVESARLAPLIGGPIGFAFDYSATRSVGAFARAYYRDSRIIDVEVN